MPLETQVHHRFIEGKITLSLAESITGGSLSSRLVSQPDSSRYFLGGVVAYSNSAKKNILQVSSETLEKYGAVNEEVAREMAEGVHESFASDVALSVTGVAGPSGAPVGKVCFALARSGKKTLSWTLQFTGDRAQIIEEATRKALSILLSEEF